MSKEWKANYTNLKVHGGKIYQLKDLNRVTK